ncbi:hypothetical protein SAMN02745446_02333, partial [Desulfococcus multivorans DSM 2059]
MVQTASPDVYTGKKATSLNPLESGQWFRLRRNMVEKEIFMKSQSPRIGAVVQT